MPSYWQKSIKREGKLKVFHDAKSWAMPIKAAIDSFNHFSFGVELVPVKDKDDANVVIKLAMGASEYPWPGDPWVEGHVVKTTSGFRADSLHGSTRTLLHHKTHHIHFAVIFLPGAVKVATDGQKHVVVIHELLHAAGLNGKTDGKDDPGGGHEDSGIMYPIMSPSGKGLIENFSGNTAKPMPPIRLGPYTHCTLMKYWTDATECKVDI